MNELTTLLDALEKSVATARSFADGLQAVVDEIAKIEPSKNEKTKTYTLEDVRGVLAQKSQIGFTAEVKALIKKYGGSKLSDVESCRYEEIIKEAEELK